MSNAEKEIKQNPISSHTATSMTQQGQSANQNKCASGQRVQQGIHIHTTTSMEYIVERWVRV